MASTVVLGWLGVLTLSVLVWGAVSWPSDRTANTGVVALGNLLDHLRSTFLILPFGVFMLAILLLERCLPATDRPSTMSATGYDAGVGAVALAFQFLAVNVFVGAAYGIYGLFLPKIGGDLVGLAPNWLRVVAGLLLADFLQWASHVVRHKVPALWQFHAMHHSQREMNAFTAYRNHPVDVFANSALQSAFLYLLQVPFDLAVPIGIGYSYFLMFVHTNATISFGPLDRLVVSPHFHRVHHALDARLHHHNFGAILSIWDTIFGTAYHGPIQPLDTGISGASDESEANPLGPIRLYVRQVVAPFQAIALGIRAKRRPS